MTGRTRHDPTRAGADEMARRADTADTEGTEVPTIDGEPRKELWSSEGDPIREHLRRAYDGVAGEPIPERLQDLLDALRKKESE